MNRNVSRFGSSVAMALFGICLSAAGVHAQGADASSFPRSAVTIVVPFPPGASTDQIARAIQPKLQANIQQSVVIENKGGASGSLGSAAAARAAPNGYTILVAPNNVFTMNSFFFKTPSFDPLQDLMPITTATLGVLGVVVHPSLPVNTLAEFIEYARKNDVSFATGGVGTPHHLFAEYLSQLGKFRMTHVPYRGSAPASADVFAGHVKVGIFTLSSVLPQAAAGIVKILAVGEKERFVGAPNVPTIAETFPGFEVSLWQGIYAPAGTPKGIVDKLHIELVKALNDPGVKKTLTELGLPVVADTPDDLARRQRADYARWGALAKSINITPQ